MADDFKEIMQNTIAATEVSFEDKKFLLLFLKDNTFFQLFSALYRIISQKIDGMSHGLDSEKGCQNQEDI